MQRKQFSRIAGRPLAILTAGLVLAGSALAAGPQYHVLYAFQGGNDATQPAGALVAGPGGVLYGAATQGGANYCPYSGLHCGAVFQLTPPATTAGTWTESVLYSFTGGNDGMMPTAGVILDKAGNLYGTTTNGNTLGCTTANCGTAFELTRPITPGGAWTETTLHIFTGGAAHDGARPSGGLVFDKAGNLYGTTAGGGDLSTNCEDCGTVFELQRPSTQGGPWTERILHSFPVLPGCINGYEPAGGVIFDKAGNLYGTTVYGGQPCPHQGFGTVFELTPPGRTGGAWTHTTLYRFSQTSGYWPQAGLTLDAKGNLYGTTSEGVPYGTVFELTPPATKGGAWTHTVLHTFTGGADGGRPAASLLFDQAGNLYSTTSGGTVFKLAPPATKGGTWTESVLHYFTGGHDGILPSGGLLFGPGGALYGATMAGGVPQCGINYGGCGTVFSVAP